MTQEDVLQIVDRPSPQRQLLALLASLLLCQAAGGVGAIATFLSRDDWYSQIEKPSWTPPNWLFGPVWTFLFCLMAVAAWLVWRSKGSWREAKVPLLLFSTQLLLNMIWSWLFFGLRCPGCAVVEIIVLWVAICWTTVSFYQVKPAASLLMLPYLAWTTFAVALNLAIWSLNS